MLASVFFYLGMIS